MQSSAAPSLMPVPFADSGTKTVIPVDSQINITPGRASYTTGFPPLTMTPIVAGGIAPYGEDFNGILNAVTQSIRWLNAGGLYPFDSDFALQVSGYPKGALLPRADGIGFWVSSLDGNVQTPDGTAAWRALSPQGWDYALDTGAANAYAMSPEPQILALNDGLTLRFLSQRANTGPATLKVSSLPVKPLLSLRHGALTSGQIGIGSLCTVQYVLAMDSWVLISSSGAAVPTTLAGYGITDAYTKAQVDSMVASQSKVVSSPTVSGPTSTTSGNSITLTATATSLLSGGSIASFTWTDPNGVTSTTTASSGSASKAFTATGSIGTSYVVSVYATDNAGNRSSTVQKSVSITNHSAPTTPTSITVASSVFQGSTGNQLSVTGSTASDGATLTYSLAQSGSASLTFSKTSGIAAGEVVTFSAPSVAADTPVTISAVAVDSLGAISTSRSLIVTIAVIPSQVGTPYAGGFYIGSMRYPDGLYALIDAGKSAEASLAWNNGGTGNYIITGATDFLDGKKNTDVLIAAPSSGSYLSKAAKYCRDYAGGGYADWYLPSYYELEACYRNAKPTAANNTTNATFDGSNPYSQPVGAKYTSTNPTRTTAAIYMSGGAQAFDLTNYWTSTGNRSSNYPDGAFRQTFDSGYINIDSSIGSALRVRPMRKVKIGN